MGGASLGSRHSLMINSANPASYNAIDSLSFLFEFGVDATLSNYKGNSGNKKTTDANFRYFSLNWPVTRKIGMGMGIQPYSDMGYEVGFTDDSQTDIGTIIHNYQGEGTTSKAYIGAAFKPFKNLSIGANLNYIFGRLNQNTLVAFDDPQLFYLSKTEGTRLRDFSLTYGLQYDFKIKKDEFLTLGATFENQTDLTVLHRLYSFKVISIGTSSLSDTIKYVNEEKDKITLPSTLGLGLSYNKLNKLEINADYYYAAWGKSSFYGAKDELITDQSRLSAGIEYIPDAFSIRSYLSRIKYRAGIHHENSYLKLNDQQIKEIGISFGVGIPVPKSKSTANFAFEFGKKGTTDNDLVRNNYAKISLYLALYDYWFIKRKFD